MKRERGVALLAAIVIFAIAAAIAVGIQFRSALALRRAAGNASLDQALQAQAGAEAVGAWILADDTNQTDDFTEKWHLPQGPVELIDGVSIAGQITDLDGRFNLNSLVDDQGAKDPVAVEIFRRLLRTLDIPEQKADLVIDSIDSDQQTEPNGAEDSLYTSQQPSNRPSNRPMLQVSELLAVPQIGLEIYLRLAPHVTALPRDRREINLCTASGVLLDALVDQRLWSANASTLETQRKSGCYPNILQFEQLFGADPAEYQKIKNRIKVQSNFFELRSLVTIGSQPFDLQSLFMRTSGATGKPEVRVLTRTMAE
jgi:general secretion pathway protein K